MWCHKTFISILILIDTIFIDSVIHRKHWSLHIISENTDFHWPVFSRTRTVAAILYTGEWQPVFSHILCSSFIRDLYRGCLVYVVPLRYVGSKLLINLRRQFRVRKSCSCAKNFSYTRFCGICSLLILFEITTSKMGNFWSRLLFHKNLLINRLLTSVFVLVNRILFERSNGSIIKCLIACLMN